MEPEHHPSCPAVLALARAGVPEAACWCGAPKALCSICGLTEEQTGEILQADGKHRHCSIHVASGGPIPRKAQEQEAEVASLRASLEEAQKETASAIAHGSTSFVEAVQLAHKLEQRLKDAEELLE